MKIKRGDVTEFRHFFDEFYSSFCFFAHRIVGDQEVAKDIVQDSFICMWDKRSLIISLESAKSYMYKFIKHRCLNYLRDNHCDRNIEAESLVIPDFDQLLIEDESYRILYQAIQLLPPQGKRIMELSVEGYKNQAIADQLGISLATVKTLKSRALKFLRCRLDGASFNFFSIFFN